MKREEILAASRKDNQNRDEREQAAFSRAGQRACAAGGIVCGLLILIDTLFSTQVSYAPWAVYLSITGTMLLSKGIQLDQRHERVFGIAQLILSAVFLILYALRLRG